MSRKTCHGLTMRITHGEHHAATQKWREVIDASFLAENSHYFELLKQ